MVRKFRSVWNPARIVSFSPYFFRFDAVGARRCGLMGVVIKIIVLGGQCLGIDGPVSTSILESFTGETETDSCHL